MNKESFERQVCLAIDATNRWLVAGFVAGEADRLNLQIRAEAPRESFRRLVPEIRELLKAGKLDRPDWIAAARGPGSFTGTRISVGAARNLAQLWDVPVFSVSSIALYLYCCARQARESGAEGGLEIAVMIDGKQERVFAAHSTVQSALAGSPLSIVDRSPDEFLTRLHDQHPGAAVYVDDPASIEGYLRNPIVLERVPSWNLIQPPRAVDLRDLCLTMPASRSTWSELVPEYLRMDPATSKFTERQKPI
ncbi:MAG: tRNA (adenosine(37)-N6)-threonylcarbamoyltransferase complex dimerization subunit type 1 TsaB [Leptospirales bacterium]|jgi:tRNA threonylcarbamoyl adenosine modification protein YeaZ